MSTTIPSVSQLKRAIVIAEQIQSLETELTSILGGGATVSKAVKTDASSGGKAKRKYNFSPEARAEIAAAQKARWARQKKAAT